FIDQVTSQTLTLAHVESRGRDEIHLQADGDIANDPVTQPGLSHERTSPVVIGGSLYFAAGGSVGKLADQDISGLQTNNALVVAAVGDDATINTDVDGAVALVQVGSAQSNSLADVDAPTPETVSLSLNIGDIKANNASL